MTLREIEHLLRDFILTSPSNTLGPSLGEPAWDDILVGLAPGEDPVFQSFKTHVGEFHFTPEELFNLTFPDQTASPEELSVISWVLPQREATKASNRAETRYPSRHWVMARFPGEEFNILLRRHCVDSLALKGIRAVAPQLSPEWKQEISPRFGRASSWSERHVAYAAGLGTFGLSDGLITSRGKAHRLGSVVARIRLKPTPRPYTNHHAYCLFFTTGKCLDCAKRCPVGAIGTRGHDKEKCWAHAGGTCARHIREAFGFDGYGCGLCQTGVACESGIPEAG